MWLLHTPRQPPAMPLLSREELLHTTKGLRQARVTYAGRWIGKGCGGRGWRWMCKWCSCHRVRTLVLWVCALNIIYSSNAGYGVYTAAKVFFIYLLILGHLLFDILGSNSM